jgi:hypothetical protein
MLRLGFAPVEVMLTLPLAAPLVVGEKSTVNDVLWPAVNESEQKEQLDPRGFPCPHRVLFIVFVSRAGRGRG